MTEDEVDERIRQLCEAKGWKFKPWECPPWLAGEYPKPYRPGTAGYASWPKAQRLRQRLLEEIEQELAATEKPAKRESNCGDLPMGFRSRSCGFRD